MDSEAAPMVAGAARSGAVASYGAVDPPAQQQQPRVRFVEATHDDHSDHHGHSHGGADHHDDDGGVDSIAATRDKERRALTRALVFCVFFMVVECVGGYVSHSLAILTDATHLMTDVGAYALSIFSLIAAGRAASDRYSYGWHRAEVLGTLFSVFTIWALVGAIVLEAVSRSWDILECAKFEHLNPGWNGNATAAATSAATSGGSGKRAMAAPQPSLPAAPPANCVAIDASMMITGDIPRLRRRPA